MSAPAGGLATIVETFTRQGFVLVRKLLPAERAAALRAHLEEMDARGRMQRGDLMVPDTPSIFGDLELDHLMELLRPAAEACTGLTLHSTYTYARIYRHGDVLKPHTDRAASEIALSINLGQDPPDQPWALNIKGEGAPSTAAVMMPGDVLFYRGMEKLHWRDPYAGNKMAQAFVFYVDANGPHAGEKLDRRDYLGASYKYEDRRPKAETET
jgi:hypothetical protein